MLDKKKQVLSCSPEAVTTVLSALGFHCSSLRIER